MPSRRRFLIGSGTAGVATLAGCLGAPEPRYVGESGEEPDTRWWPQPEFDRIASCYNPRSVGPRGDVTERWSIDISGPSSRPVVALSFGTLASNTIEGIALSKLVNLVVLGPAIVVAVVPEPLQFAAGVLPTYWPVKAVVAGILGESSWLAYLGVGTLVQLVWLTGVGRRFVSRSD